MPVAAQLVPSKDAMIVVKEYQVGRVETVVAIDLNEQTRREIETSLQHGSTLVQDHQLREVGPLLHRLMKRRK